MTHTSCLFCTEETWRPQSFQHSSSVSLISLQGPPYLFQETLQSCCYFPKDWVAIVNEPTAAVVALAIFHPTVQLTHIRKDNILINGRIVIQPGISFQLCQESIKPREVGTNMKMCLKWLMSWTHHQVQYPYNVAMPINSSWGFNWLLSKTIYHYEMCIQWEKTGILWNTLPKIKV